MAKVVKSGLASKLRGIAGKVVQEEVTKEIDYGVMSMPGGVRQGVAKLVDCYFKEYGSGDNKGEYFFRASGVAIEPESVGTNRVKDLYTSVMEPLCDTKKSDGTIVTKEEHLAVVINELRKLGADMDGVDEDSLEAVAAALKEAGPYFRFSTTEGKANPPKYPNARVFENWHGIKGLEDYTPPEDNAGVQDNTADEPAAAPKKGTNPPPVKASAKKVPQKAEPVEDIPFGDKLDMLVDKADSGDEAAQTEIQDHALSIGITQDEVNNTGSWSDVADLIRAKESEEGGEDGAEDNETVDLDALGASADEEQGTGEEGEACAKLRELAEEAGLDPDEYPTWSELATALSPSSEGTEAEEAPAVPAKGEVWHYKPKGAKKPMEVEVIAVFEKNSTCNVKSLDDGKAYKSVPFSELTT